MLVHLHLRDRVEHHGQNSWARPAYSQGSVAQGGSKFPVCVNCCSNHSDGYCEGSASFFSVVKPGISRNNVPRISKEAVMGAIELNLH